jgi:hypothetical protein
MCATVLVIPKPDNNSGRSAGVILRSPLAAETDQPSGWVHVYFAGPRDDVIGFNETDGEPAFDFVVNASAEGSRKRC